MLTIVDYGMGTLRSEQKALEKVGHEAVIGKGATNLERADKIILPGVGASADALAAVRAQGLEEPIKRAIDAGKPFLGICLGLQMLFDVSYEDGEHRGLGVLPGKVVRFDVPRGLKVPHMGWNQVRFDRRPPIFANTAADEHFYFVHSYHVVCDDPSLVATTTDYGGRFCSSVWRDNVYATQFHPEKSQRAGLAVLKAFAELPG